ncbi:hypothetical protein J5U23_01387 [Saccharolobus shibatae B12]|uniref:Uncharacterized protein n=1 Tax=Saccharolobus shibatae (strain ATCC 51178 / DSM 5389 / JCM 8931 / NBRC 15437 / B12) TaxID=523848 RepID=A0A8F5BNG1_SACSH|nr:hypothetical protein J5U23_01387 [Saccharolobus shibatae B12]
MSLISKEIEASNKQGEEKIITKSKQSFKRNER